jgi:hypothetical protein
MSVLASLGTAIPRPAFAKCMEATLAVWLGNPWGHSWTAVPHAERVLDSLRVEQWEYYLNECLRRDRTVLDKLVSAGKPAQRWREVASRYRFSALTSHDKLVRILVTATLSDKPAHQLSRVALRLRHAITR